MGIDHVTKCNLLLVLFTELIHTIRNLITNHTRKIGDFRKLNKEKCYCRIKLDTIKLKRFTGFRSVEFAQDPRHMVGG